MFEPCGHIAKISSTYLIQQEGLCSNEFMDFVLKSSIKILASPVKRRGLMGAFFICL